MGRGCPSLWWVLAARPIDSPTVTPAPDGEAVAARQVHKSYGAKVALAGVDLSVAAGEVVALLGPNGAGKTTLVEILEGVRRADGGRVRVLGADPVRAGRAWREQLGLVFQEAGVEPHLTVREVLTRHAGLYPRALPVAQVLAQVGLGDAARRRVAALSGGQRRRLDLALGVVGRPRLLFLDEPTTGFDPAARRDAWALVRTLSQAGTTVLLTTHDMDEAEALADRAVLLVEGRVAANGPPAELGVAGEARVRFRLPPDVRVEQLPVLAVDDGPGRGMVSTTDPTRTLHLLTGWMLQRGLRLVELSVSRPRLEEVYLQLTTPTEPPGE